MNPAFLISELRFSALHGANIRDCWRLAKNSVRGRLQQSQAPGRIDHVVLKFPNNSLSVALRRGNTDTAVLMQVFHYGEYNPAQIDFGSVRTVVDAGANIGLSSLYFWSRWRPRRILAIEPDESNLWMLRRNLTELNGPVAEIIPAALWRDPVPLVLRRGTSAVSARAETSSATSPGDIQVDTITPAMLIEKLGGTDIDVFKIDIEGGELSLFSASNLGEWVRRVRFFLMECHSHFGFGASPAVIARALEPHGFEVIVYSPEKGLVCARRR